MAIGIYQIKNLVNGKSYIGSSVRLEKRLSDHKWHHRNNHYSANRHLMAAFAKYGLDNFSFDVIENCTKDTLIEREQYWIDTLKPEYNKRKQAANNLEMAFTWSEDKKTNTEQRARELCAERGWEFVSIDPKGRVTIKCSKHGHEATSNKVSFFYKGQGCRHCGFERSSTQNSETKLAGSKYTCELAQERCAAQGIELVSMDVGTVTIHCPKHDRTEVKKRGNFFLRTPGCRLCGNERRAAAIASKVRERAVEVTEGGN